MGFKKMILGEPVPDKDDPKYREKHEKSVKAGISFAKAVRLDKAAAFVQRFAMSHKYLFLTLVFSFVLFSVGLNLWRMSNAVTHRGETSSAVKRQENELHLQRHHQTDAERKKEYTWTEENPGEIDEPQTIEDYGAFEKD